VSSTNPEHRDLPVGIIIPFFSNELVDEIHSEVEDVDSDVNDDDDDPNTLTAFGVVSLSKAYTTERPTSAGLPVRKPRLKMQRPQFMRRRTGSDKEIWFSYK